MDAKKNTARMIGANHPVAGAAVHSIPEMHFLRGFRRLSARLARGLEKKVLSVAARDGEKGGLPFYPIDGNSVFAARLRHERVMDLQTNFLLWAAMK